MERRGGHRTSHFSRGRKAAIGSGGRAIDERPAYLEGWNRSSCSCSLTRGSRAPPQLTPAARRGPRSMTPTVPARQSHGAVQQLRRRAGAPRRHSDTGTLLKFSLWSRAKAPRVRAQVPRAGTVPAYASRRKTKGFRRDPGPAPPSLSPRS